MSRAANKSTIRSWSWPACASRFSIAAMYSSLFCMGVPPSLILGVRVSANRKNRKSQKARRVSVLGLSLCLLSAQLLPTHRFGAAQILTAH